MSTRRRVIMALIVAGLLGAAMAWATDQGGSSRTVASQLRNTVGGLSTPWVLIPFVAGAICLRARAGALVGLATTLSALSGWYLCATLVEDLGGHGFLGDLRLEFGANRVYFVAGLVSGPMFGALGSWWRRTRTLPAAVLSGALLMGEPLVMGLLTALHSAHLLSPGMRFPPVLGIVANTWVQGSLAASVLIAEFVLGLALVVIAVRSYRHRHVAAPAGT